MSILIPNISEIFLLRLILGKQNCPSGQVLRLFKNALTPNENTTINDITEADFNGYSGINLTGSDWTISNNYGVTTAVCVEKEFVFTSSATIYGYYLTTNEATPALMWLERFSLNSSEQYFQLPSTGGVVRVTPKISLD